MLIIKARAISSNRSEKSIVNSAIREIKDFKKSVTSRKPVRKENVEELDVVQDYANLIKNKREEMQMTQDDLA